MTGSEQSTEAAKDTAESTGDVEQEQEQEGSSMETTEVRNGSEVVDSAGGKQREAVCQHDAMEIQTSLVSNSDGQITNQITFWNHKSFDKQI